MKEGLTTAMLIVLTQAEDEWRLVEAECRGDGTELYLRRTEAGKKEVWSEVKSS